MHVDILTSLQVGIEDVARADLVDGRRSRALEQFEETWCNPDAEVAESFLDAIDVVVPLLSVRSTEKASSASRSIAEESSERALENEGRLARRCVNAA